MTRESAAPRSNTSVMLASVAAIVGFLLFNGNIKLTKEAQAVPQESAIELPALPPPITEQQLDTKLSELRDELQNSIDSAIRGDTNQTQEAIVAAVADRQTAMQTELREKLDAQSEEITKLQGAITDLSKQQTTTAAALAAASKAATKQAATTSNESAAVRYYYTEAPAGYAVYRAVQSQPTTVTYRYYSSMPASSMQYQSTGDCANGVCAPQYSTRRSVLPQYSMPRYSAPMQFRSAGNCSNGMCSQ